MFLGCHVIEQPLVKNFLLAHVFYLLCQGFLQVFQVSVWLLKLNQNYLSLQSWQSQKIYDVWIWLHWWVRYLKRDCISLTFFVIQGQRIHSGKFRHLLLRMSTFRRQIDSVDCILDCFLNPFSLCILSSPDYFCFPFVSYALFLGLKYFSLVYLALPFKAFKN